MSRIAFIVFVLLAMSGLTVPTEATRIGRVHNVKKWHHKWFWPFHIVHHVKPVNTIVVHPAKPVVEHVKPIVVHPVKPIVVHPVKPVVEHVKPVVVHPVKPVVVHPVKPVVEPVKPVVEPVGPHAYGR